MTSLRFLISVFVVAGSASALAQNVATRTNEFEVDFTDPKKVVSTTIPVINWITPVAETTYAQENKYKITFEIQSSTPIKNITISIKESPDAASRGIQTIQPDATQNLNPKIERNLTLMDGDNVLEIVAENMDGVKTVSQKVVHVGSVGLADAAKLDRTDYALIFATDNYDNWPDLVNPVFDSRTVADELKKTYGFKVEMIENATQNEIFEEIKRVHREEV